MKQNCPIKTAYIAPYIKENVRKLLCSRAHDKFFAKAATIGTCVLTYTRLDKYFK